MVYCAVLFTKICSIYLKLETPYIGTPWVKVSDLFSRKLNSSFAGCFDPINYYFDNYSKYFLGWPKRYFGYNGTPWVKVQGSRLPYRSQVIKHSRVFTSVINHDPEYQHAPKWCPGIDKSKALVTLLLDQTLDIVSQLCMAPNTGKRLNIYRLYGTYTRQGLEPGNTPQTIEE